MSADIFFKDGKNLIIMGDFSFHHLHIRIKLQL